MLLRMLGKVVSFEVLLGMEFDGVSELQPISALCWFINQSPKRLLRAERPPNRGLSNLLEDY